MIKDKELISEYFTKHYPAKDKYVYNEIVYFLGGAIAFVIAIFIAMMRTSSADQRSVYDSYSTSRNKKYRETYDDFVEEIDNTTDIKPKEKEKIKNQAAEIDAKRTELKELTEERKKELIELLKTLDEGIKGASPEQKKQYEDIKKLLGSVDSLELEENLKKLQNFINESNINVDKKGINKKFNFIYDIFNREKSLFKAIGNLWTKFTMNFGTNLKGGIVNIINEWGGFFTNKKSNLKIEDLAEQISKEEIIYISCSGFDLLDNEIRIKDTNSISFEKGNKTNIFYYVKEQKIFITDSNKEKFIYISKDKFLTQEKFVEFIQTGTLKLNENIIKITTDFKDSNFKIPVKILNEIDSRINIKEKIDIKLEIDPFSDDFIRTNEAKNFILFNRENNLSFKIDRINILNNSKDLTQIVLEENLKKTKSVFDFKKSEVVSTVPSLKDFNIDDLLKEKIVALRDKKLKIGYDGIILSNDILIMPISSINANTNITSYEMSAGASGGSPTGLNPSSDDIAEAGVRNSGLDRPNIIYFKELKVTVFFSVKDKDIIILEDTNVDAFKKLLEDKNYTLEDSTKDSYYKMGDSSIEIPIEINKPEEKTLTFNFLPYDKKFKNQINFINNKKIVITDENLGLIDPDNINISTKKTIYNVENLNSDGLFEYLVKFPFFLKTPITVNVSKEEIITAEEVLMNIDFNDFLKGKITTSKENKISICQRGKAFYYLKIEKNEITLKSFKSLDVNKLVTQIAESKKLNYISNKYIILPIDKVIFYKDKIKSFQVIANLYKKVIEDLKREDEENETNEESPPDDMLNRALSNDDEDVFADLDDHTSVAKDSDEEDPFADILTPVDVLKQIYSAIESKDFTPNKYIDKDGNINFSNLINDKIMGEMSEIVVDNFITSSTKLEFLKNKIEAQGGSFESDEGDSTDDSNENIEGDSSQLNMQLFDMSLPESKIYFNSYSVAGNELTIKNFNEEMARKVGQTEPPSDFIRILIIKDQNFGYYFTNEKNSLDFFLESLDLVENGEEIKKNKKNIESFSADYDGEIQYLGDAKFKILKLAKVQVNIKENVSANDTNVIEESFNYKNKFNNLQSIFNEIFYREIKGKKYNYFENSVNNIEMIPLIKEGEIILSKIPSIINVKDLDKINSSNVFEYDLISKSITKVHSRNHNIDYLENAQDKIIFIQKKEASNNLYEGDLKINKLTPGAIETASEFFKFNEDNEKIKNVITENKAKDIKKNFLSGIRCQVEIIESGGSITYKVITKGQISSNKFDKKIEDLNDEEKNNLKDVIKKTIEKQKESSSKEQTSGSSPEPELETSPENIVKRFDLSSFLNNLELIQNPNGSLLLTKEGDQNFLNFNFGENDGAIIKIFIEKYSSKKEDFEYIIEEIEKIKPTKIKIPVILETAEISDNNLIIKQTSNNNKVVWGDSTKESEKTPLSPDGIKVPFSKNEITIGTTMGNYIIIDNGADIETGINTIIKINKDKNGFTIENKLSQTFLNKSDPIEKDKIYKKANIQIGLFPKGESFSVEIEKAKEKIKLENTQFQIFITQLNKIFETPPDKTSKELKKLNLESFLYNLKYESSEANELVLTEEGDKNFLNFDLNPKKVLSLNTNKVWIKKFRNDNPTFEQSIIIEQETTDLTLTSDKKYDSVKFKIEIQKVDEKTFKISKKNLDEIFIQITSAKQAKQELTEKPGIEDKTPFTKGRFFLSLEKIKADNDTLSDKVDDQNGGIIFRQKKDSDTEFIGTLWTPDLNVIKFEELKKLQKYFNISLIDYVLNEEFEITGQRGFISDDKLIITIADNKAIVKQKGNLRDASRAQIITNLRKILQNLIGLKPEDDEYQKKKKGVYQKVGIGDLFRDEKKDSLTPAEVSESASSDIGLIIGKISGNKVKLGVGAPISLQLMNKFKNNENYKLFYYIKRDDNYYYIELNENIIKLLNTIFNSQSFKDSKNVRYKIDDLKEKIKENILLFRKVFKIDPKKISEKVKLDDMKLGIIKKERLIEKKKKKFFKFPTEEASQPKIKESGSEEKTNQETPDKEESITSSYKIDNNFDSMIINEVFKKWKR